MPVQTKQHCSVTRLPQDSAEKQRETTSVCTVTALRARDRVIALLHTYVHMYIIHWNASKCLWITVTVQLAI